MQVPARRVRYIPGISHDGGVKSILESDDYEYIMETTKLHMRLNLFYANELELARRRLLGI